MAITANPETRILHLNPGEKCNLDDARKDTGPKPFKVSTKQVRSLLAEGYEFCENEDDEE